jgi:hypothetical protein
MNKHFVFAKILANLLDSQFAVGKYSFGIDPLLDFIPGFGAVISFLLSLYIVWVGLQMKIPRKEIRQMITNVVADFILGLLPVLGWAGDFFFKANIRNVKILEKYAGRKIFDAEIISE